MSSPDLLEWFQIIDFFHREVQTIIKAAEGHGVWPLALMARHGVSRPALVQAAYSEANAIARGIVSRCIFVSLHSHSSLSATRQGSGLGHRGTLSRLIVLANRRLKYIALIAKKPDTVL